MPQTANVRSLARIRLEQGLSRRVLARRAGCSPATIFGAEKGRRVPIPQTARRLSEALNVRLADVAEFRSAMEEWTARLERNETERKN